MPTRVRSACCASIRLSAGCRSSGAAASSRDGLDGVEQEETLLRNELADLGDEPKLVAHVDAFDAVREVELEPAYVPELKGRSPRGVRTVAGTPDEDVPACLVAAVRCYVENGSVEGDCLPGVLPGERDVLMVTVIPSEQRGKVLVVLWG